MAIDVIEVSLADDGRLRIYPSTVEWTFEHIYREAAGVHWNTELQCFQSTIPKDWDHKAWYTQIVSVVKSGLGVRLKLTDDTIFSTNSETFEIEIRSADAEVQEWETAT